MKKVQSLFYKNKKEQSKEVEECQRWYTDKYLDFLAEGGGGDLILCNTVFQLLGINALLKHAFLRLIFMIFKSAAVLCNK